MTLGSSLALFGAMVVLALIPGPGVLVVVARTLAAGLRQGASTVAGIVAGDFVFITLALLGLTALSKLMGGFFMALKYLGAAYLVWLGISILSSKKGLRSQVARANAPSHFASFTAGLATTLGNAKAILFYLSFFPAFLDLANITLLDAATLYVIAVVAVGGVMFGYAYVAHKAKRPMDGQWGGKYLRLGSGTLLIGSGVFVAGRA